MAKCALTRAEARKKFNLPDSKIAVALLPGSRVAEVKRMLGVMLASARLIDSAMRAPAAYLIPAVGTLDDAFLDGFLKDCGVDARVVRGNMYAALRAVDSAVVTSGTATLETALIGAPMVITYKLSGLTHLIAKTLVGIENIGLPNIVAGRLIVKELIQNEASPENIACEVVNILKDPVRKDDIIKGYDDVRKALAPSGKKAADMAAEEILKLTL
jgi:lipid-A-disaccharide synthase